MPYERKRQYRKKRKRYRKRKQKSTVSTLGFGSTPFPKSYLTKHRYVETVSIDPGIISPAVVYYSCNSLFDPTSAVGGHQPLGFDQMTPIYDHYTVLGSKLTAQFFSGDDSTNGADMVFCYVNDDTSAVLTYDTVLEQQKGVCRALTSANSKQTTRITQKFSAKNYFGVTDVKDNKELKGSTTADPTEQAFFVVGAQGIDPATNPTTIQVIITIDYIALWTERKSLSQS